MPPATITPDALPPGLVEACVRRNCVLCTGSDVAALAAEPPRQKILEEVLDWAVEERLITKKEAGDYHWGLMSTDWKTAANNLIHKLKGHQLALHDLLRKTYKEKVPGLLPRDLARVLEKLPFAAALTNSLSPLLELLMDTPDTHIFTPKDCERMEALLQQREFFLLKLNGSLLQRGSLLLSPDQFSEAVRASSLAPFMETLFSTRTVLFVGASLDSIVEHFRHVSLKKPAEPWQHFALLPTKGDEWMQKAEWLKNNYGVQVLPFSAKSWGPDLQAFFERLDKAVTSTSAPAPLARTAPVLRNIRLEDIGPFDREDFKLSSSFTIILGSEPVGKTLILQAIAAGLCGQKALPCVVEHLVKITSTSASIRLESATSAYSLQIRLMSALESETTLIGTSPLEAERWLALGYSATPAAHAGVRQAGVEEMPGADLFPLLTGTSESQLAKFKRWLLDLTIAGGSLHHPPLVAEIFELLAQLLEVPSLHWGDVNVQTSKVTVINDDGRVPLEALGQSTTSLIAWVGLLMKHLHDSPSRVGLPTHFRLRPALVLIDDIDSFLGPLCLQKLILNLRRIFPNVQFIASARNERITCGLDADEVIHLVREKDKDKDGKRPIRRRSFTPPRLVSASPPVRPAPVSSPLPPPPQPTAQFSSPEQKPVLTGPSKPVPPENRPLGSDATPSPTTTLTGPQPPSRPQVDRPVRRPNHTIRNVPISARKVKSGKQN